MDKRRKIQGVVVSDKAPKTIVVEITGYRKHSKYQKRVQYRAKYYAHDENGLAHTGDTVTISECRPLSALKRFTLVSVDKKAVESVKVLEEKEVEKALHENEEAKGE